MTALDPKRFELPSKETYKLDNMISVAAKLGDPQLNRKTILVAGTNGKGSTCAYLTALFREAGIRVGTFSSPHVIRKTERIRINGKPISEAILEKYEKKYETELSSLTYFERFTILAWLIFRDEKVDWQILEVGMGGRLDATNISDPDFSCITRIDYDHQEVLGNTLNEIAREKAGIMRKDRPTFLAKQTPEAMKALVAYAYSIEAILLKTSLSSSDFKILDGVKRKLGSAQFENAKLALSVFKAAVEKPLKASAIRKALSVTSLWPGRFQILRKNPVMIVDGAHNSNSIDELCKNLRRCYPKIKFELNFGVMAQKDVSTVLKSLKKFVSHTRLVSFYPERERPPADLKVNLNKIGFKDVSIAESVPEMVKTAWGSKKAQLIAGSFYLAGAFLKEVESQGLSVKDSRE